MTLYAWAPRRGFPVPAQVVGDVVERVQKESPEEICSAEALVDEARPDDSPLHPAFEWDDAYAAEEYRKGQARKLISSVRVVRVEQPRDVEPSQAFVSIQVHTVQGSEHGYVAVKRALDDDQLREQLRRDAVNRLRSLQLRYSALPELGPVWEALDQVS